MTRTRAFRLLLRLALGTGIFFFTTASSCDAGDRALGGGCPAGEVCDPATENGLHFEGATFAEGLLDVGDVKRVAVGGRQDVRVFDTDEEGHHVTLELPYDASFDTGALGVEGIAGNTVTLRGEQDGAAVLRITNPDTGELFDRTTVFASAIDSVELVPSLVTLFDDGSDTQRLYTPGAIGYVGLRSIDDNWLVDEDTAIGGSGITQTRWDTFRVGNLAPGHYSLIVTAGDHPAIDIGIDVAHADSLVHLFGTDVTRDGRAFVCFGARSAGRPIHSSWTFEIAGGTLEDSSFVGCTGVLPGAGNEVTLTAHADGLSTTITLPIVASSNKPRLARRIARTAGDRAIRATDPGVGAAETR